MVINLVKSLCQGILGLKQYRILILEMTKRELSDQFAGQVLGFLWAIIFPLVFIGVYIFIFSVVFHNKIGGTHEMPLDYTSYILAGLIPWMSLQTSLAKSAVALTGQSNLVQQVVFPIEVLPTKMVLSSFLGQFISIIILLIYVLFTHGSLTLSYLLLPLLLFFQFLAMLGIGFILAAITPFFRDLKDLVTVFIMIGIYLVPIVYLPQWTPKLFKPIIYANPISYMIWCYQDALYFGRFAHPWAWPIFIIGSLIIFAVGYRIFKKLTPYFGNVL